MKQTLYLFFFFLLASCQQENLFESKGTGQLTLGNIAITSASEQPITTKVIDSDLIIQITSANSEVKRYAVGQIPSSISLEAGDYTFEAFTAEYESWQNGAVYYKSQTFSIIAGKITEITNVNVPMINCGIRFEIMDGLPFYNYMFQATPSGGSTITLSDEGVNAYFPVSSIGCSLFYTLSATNTDSETVGPIGQTQTVTLEAGKIYRVTYDLATSTSQINNK